ncbi:MAG: hypothetical protein K5906_03960 [Bacilli bacterium]|nr:hypothetical protein [Bacilli bacterium]
MAKIRFKRDNDNDTKPITKEEKVSLIIRLIVILILFTGGIVAMSFGIKSCTTKAPGYYTIEGNSDPDVPSYDDGDVKLVFYFEGNNATSAHKEVTNIYSEALKAGYASTSKLQHFNGYISIYDINNTNYGEEIELSSFLYYKLKDAYQYSLDYENYSIFNAPIYDYWEYLFTLDKSLASSNDPLNNESSKAYLEDLVKIIQDTNNYAISFDDNKKSVKLTVSETYQNFINTRYTYRSTKFPLISFNVIEEAIKVQYLIDSLKNAGYTKGYLTTNNGLSVSLGGLEDIYYNLYDYAQDGSYRNLGSVTFKNASGVASFRRFETVNRLYSPYYSFLKDGEKIYRSSYINNLTGYPTQYFANSNVFSTSKSILDSVLMNNELITKDSLEKTKEAISTEAFNDYYLAFTCFSKEKTIYLTTNIKEFLTIKKDLDYNLIEL